MFELTRWSPFGSVFNLHRELDEMLGRFVGREGATYRPETDPVAWAPAIESYAKDGQLHVRVALPGVDPKDVEVTVSEDQLTIRGERKTEHEGDAAGTSASSRTARSSEPSRFPTASTRARCRPSSRTACST